MGVRKCSYLLVLLNGILLAAAIALSKTTATLLLAVFNAYVLSGIRYAISSDIRALKELLQQPTEYDPVAVGQSLKGVLNDLVPGLVQRQRLDVRARENYADINAEVSHSANELHRTAEDLNGNIKEQSLSTASIAAAVTEMSYSTDDIASQMKGACEAALNSDELGHKGGDVIRSARSNTEQVAKFAETTYRLLTSLDERTTTVANISSVIRAIAEQTNLLALNAAIEAARAGDHGRGFAVVAEEVRALATRSHQSAEEISRNIDDVQQQMSAVRESMDNVVSCTDQTVAKAKEAESLLDEMATHFQSVTQLLYTISSATEQQTAAVGEISTNIESVAVLADKNSGIASQTASIASHVRQLCEQAREHR
ncbi:MAG: methyl-accepting chemotaxis protein [Pseudomonadota bacterium]